MRPLTRRQREAIVTALLGLSLKESGRRLGISWRCVEDHRGRAFKKLGVPDATKLRAKLFNEEITA